MKASRTAVSLVSILFALAALGCGATPTSPEKVAGLGVSVDSVTRRLAARQFYHFDPIEYPQVGLLASGSTGSSLKDSRVRVYGDEASGIVTKLELRFPMIAILTPVRTDEEKRLFNLQVALFAVHVRELMGLSGMREVKDHFTLADIDEIKAWFMDALGRVVRTETGGRQLTMRSEGVDMEVIIELSEGLSTDTGVATVPAPDAGASPASVSTPAVPHEIDEAEKAMADLDEVGASLASLLTKSGNYTVDVGDDVPELWRIRSTASFQDARLHYEVTNEGKKTQEVDVDLASVDAHSIRLNEEEEVEFPTEPAVIYVEASAVAHKTFSDGNRDVAFVLTDKAAARKFAKTLARAVELTKSLDGRLNE